MIDGVEMLLSEFGEHGLFGLMLLVLTAIMAWTIKHFSGAIEKMANAVTLIAKETQETHREFRNAIDRNTAAISELREAIAYIKGHMNAGKSSTVTLRQQEQPKTFPKSSAKQ